jgi:hypothetical protein
MTRERVIPRKDKLVSARERAEGINDVRTDGVDRHRRRRHRHDRVRRHRQERDLRGDELH